MELGLPGQQSKPKNYVAYDDRYRWRKQQYENDSMVFSLKRSACSTQKEEAYIQQLETNVPKTLQRTVLSEDFLRIVSRYESKIANC
jgi:hypothetical protein